MRRDLQLISTAFNHVSLVGFAHLLLLLTSINFIIILDSCKMMSRVSRTNVNESLSIFFHNQWFATLPSMSNLRCCRLHGLLLLAGCLCSFRSARAFVEGSSLRQTLHLFYLCQKLLHFRRIDDLPSLLNFLTHDHVLFIDDPTLLILLSWVLLIFPISFSLRFARTQ